MIRTLLTSLPVPAYLFRLFAKEAPGMRQNDVTDFRTFQSAQRDMMLMQCDATIDALLNRVTELRIYKAKLREATDPALGLPDPEPEMTPEQIADIQRIAANLAPVNQTEQEAA